MTLPHIVKSKEANAEHEKSIYLIAELLEADKDELLTLWLADQVMAVVADEKEITNIALDIAKLNINKT